MHVTITDNNSCWYKRSELGFRAALFFSAAALAGSFGGLLAAGITQMCPDKKGGSRCFGDYEGWRWIFIIEGLITVFVGIFCWWMVNDFPDTARFLTPDERIRALRRLRDDGQARAETEAFDRKYVFAACKDWKTWGYALCYMGCLCPLYSFSLFLVCCSFLTVLWITNGFANVFGSPPFFSGWVTKTPRPNSCPYLLTLWLRP